MSVVKGVDMSMDEIIADMTSADEVLQLKATHIWSEMLSKKVPPTNTIMPKDVILRCIEFLSFHHNPELQFEASWALTNVIASTSEKTTIVVNNGAIPKLIKLLRSPHVNVAEQAVWALGNIAGDGPETRDEILRYNCMALLLDLLKTDNPISFTRTIVWTISNLCRHKDPPPSFGVVKEALPILNCLLTGKDPHILTHASWALVRLASLTDGEQDKIQDVVGSGVVPKLITLLGSSEIDVLIPVLRAVGNIACGNDIQTDVMMDAGGLENFKKLLGHQNMNIVRDAAWALSKISVGTQKQIQRVIDSGIVPLIAKVIIEGDANAKRDAARVAENLLTRASGFQIEELIRQGMAGFLPSGIPLDTDDEQDLSLNWQMSGLRVAEETKKWNGMDHE